MGDKKEKNSNKNPSKNYPTIEQKKSEDEKTQVNHKTHTTENEKKITPSFLSKLGIQEYTNIILAITSIAMLVLVYLMTSETNKISRESNTITRESLEFRECK